MGGRRMLGGKFGAWPLIGFLLAGPAMMLAGLPAWGVGGAERDGALKVVVHINFAQSTQQGQGLKNVENILKTATARGIKAEVEIVCHADGIGLVEKARTGFAGEVASLASRGVRFVACENTMRQRSIRKEDLLAAVGTVPSGAFEVVSLQRDGYSYFKP